MCVCARINKNASPGVHVCVQRAEPRTRAHAHPFTYPPCQGHHPSQARYPRVCTSGCALADAEISGTQTSPVPATPDLPGKNRKISAAKQRPEPIALPRGWLGAGRRRRGRTGLSRSAWPPASAFLVKQLIIWSPLVNCRDLSEFQIEERKFLISVTVGMFLSCSLPHCLHSSRCSEYFQSADYRLSPGQDTAPCPWSLFLN